eukprot:6455333-Amphidinium_carterae.2
MNWLPWLPPDRDNIVCPVCNFCEGCPIALLNSDRAYCHCTTRVGRPTGRTFLSGQCGKPNLSAVLRRCSEMDKPWGCGSELLLVLLLFPQVSRDNMVLTRE